MLCYGKKRCPVCMLVEFTTVGNSTVMEHVLECENSSMGLPGMLSPPGQILRPRPHSCWHQPHELWPRSLAFWPCDLDNSQVDGYYELSTSFLEEILTLSLCDVYFRNL